MIDIHSHILSGMDDGAKSLEESVKIAEESVKAGIDGIVATPHFMEEGYRFTLPELRGKVKELQEELEKRGIELKLYSGGEVFIYPDLPKDLEKGLVPTINNSQYILLEFPMDRFPSYTEELLYALKVMGYEVIIAHPERYHQVIEDPNLLYNLAEEGIYAQVNASSLLGIFGEKVKKTAEILFQHNTVQLIGSDLHSLNRRRQTLAEGVQRLRELDRSNAELVIANNKRLIEDEAMESLEPVYYEKRRGFLARVKRYFVS